jgi:hypothetical protein
MSAPPNFGYEQAVKLLASLLSDPIQRSLLEDPGVRIYWRRDESTGRTFFSVRASDYRDEDGELEGWQRLR